MLDLLGGSQMEEGWREPTIIHLKITVFWDVAPCSSVESAQSFRHAYCLHHQSDDSYSDLLP
jgi:hypothetical protein